MQTEKLKGANEEQAKLDLFEVNWRQLPQNIRRLSASGKVALMLAVILAGNLVSFLHVNAACSVHLMLFWDPATYGTTLPAGWEAVDSTHNINGTDPTNLFIRGDSIANVGTTGGGGQTTPTVASAVVGSASASKQGGSNSTTSAFTHTHSVPSLVVGADSNYDSSSSSNLPAYHTLELMRYTVGSSACIPNTVPNHAIAMFTSLSGVSNVTQYTAQNNKMVRIWNGSSLASGGSDTDTNAICAPGSSPPSTCNDITLGAASGTSGVNNFCGLGGCTPTSSTTHTHTVAHGNATSAAPVTAGGTAAGNADPPYNQPILGELTADTPAITLNFIALFDQDPGTGWTILSNSGGAYNGVFLRPNSAGTYNQQFVGQTSHTNIYSATSSTPSATGPQTFNLNLNTNDASDTHTHSLDVTLTSQSNLPPYVNVVLAQKVNFKLNQSRWYAPISAYTETDPWPSGSLDINPNEQLHAIPLPLC